MDMARRSVKLNGLEERISIVEGDIKEASGLLGKGMFDVVTSNPPYMIAHHGLTGEQEQKAIARHEILCTFEDVARETARYWYRRGNFIWCTDLFDWRRSSGH